MSMAEEFLAGVAPGAYRGGPELDAALERLYARGCAAWPAFAVTPEPFVRDLAARVGDRARDLASLQAEDVFLAVACALGVPGAMGEIDRLLPEACSAVPGA